MRVPCTSVFIGTFFPFSSLCSQRREEGNGVKIPLGTGTLKCLYKAYWELFCLLFSKRWPPGKQQWISEVH